MYLLDMSRRSLATTKSVLLSNLRVTVLARACGFPAGTTLLQRRVRIQRVAPRAGEPGSRGRRQDRREDRHHEAFFFECSHAKSRSGRRSPCGICDCEYGAAMASLPRNPRRKAQSNECILDACGLAECATMSPRSGWSEDDAQPCREADKTSTSRFCEVPTRHPRPTRGGAKF